MTNCSGCAAPMSDDAVLCSASGRSTPDATGPQPGPQPAPPGPQPTQPLTVAPSPVAPPGPPAVPPLPPAVPDRKTRTRTAALIAAALAVVLLVVAVGYVVLHRSSGSVEATRPTPTVSTARPSPTPSDTPSNSPSASPSPSPTPSPSPSRSATDPIVVSGDAAFISPSGNLVCWLDEVGAECTTLIRNWPMAPSMPDCTRAKQPNTASFRVSEWAYVGCTRFVTGNTAIIGSGHPVPQWYDPNRDSIVAAADGSGWKGYALAYGQTVRSGVSECSVAETGVSCRDTASGHGFTLSKTSVDIH